MVAALVCGLVVASLPTDADAQRNHRRARVVAKNFAAWDFNVATFDGTVFLNVVPGVLPLYSQAVRIPRRANVIDIKASFAIFCNGGSDVCGIQCLVDGVGCVGTELLGGLIFGTSGTVIYFDGFADDDDLITYNWCQPVSGRDHLVQLNLLTFDDFTALITGLTVVVTAARVPDSSLACAPGAVQGNFVL
jgi:hypothetical protein